MVEFTRWITQGWTFDDVEDDYLNGVYLKIAQKGEISNNRIFILFPLIP
jgi:hypothetical protein